MSTSIITTIAGNGDSSFISGNKGMATSATVYNPWGVALDSTGNLLITKFKASKIIWCHFYCTGNVYIAEFGYCLIRKVTVSTSVITYIGGSGCGTSASGDGGAATSAKIDPAHVALDSSGNVYIADLKYNRIRKITISTGIISTIVGIGTTTFSGDGGSATSATLYYPVGIALDVSGRQISLLRTVV